jgi:hypothetical protein
MERINEIFSSLDKKIDLLSIFISWTSLIFSKKTFSCWISHTQPSPYYTNTADPSQHDRNILYNGACHYVLTVLFNTLTRILKKTHTHFNNILDLTRIAIRSRTSLKTINKKQITI